MITCPHCQKNVPEGALFCEHCGRILSDFPITRKLDIDADALGARPGWGTVSLGTGQDVFLQVGDASQPIDVRSNAEFIVGRGEGSDIGISPDLDLTAYGAEEAGISRMHAALRRGEGVLAIVDLDSTNGTFLNGYRLAAHQPHLVRDGDEIRLGSLVMHIYFRSQ